MKKFLGCIMITLALVLSGCSASQTSTPTAEYVEDTSSVTFVTIGGYCGVVKIVYCEQTKVMYTVSTGYYNYGDVTLLVNADGTPMLWEGE